MKQKIKHFEHFEIEQYYLQDSKIEVDIVKNELLITIYIPTEKFKNWLEDDGRLDFCLDSCDHSGNHVQVTGKITFEEYLEGNKRMYILQDLYEYIVTNPITYRKKIYENSLDSILAAFENYPKSPLNYIK